MKKRIKTFLLSCYLLMVTSACVSFNPPDAKLDQVRTQAKKPTITKSNSELRTLPKPVGLITAAVYAFKDQTGQYKPTPANQLSTAVSQGADTILIKALLDSGWFLPVERSGLNNLLTERKITQANILETSKATVPTLPPVSPANVIIEGSVVGYDFNIKSGGAGAKILGIGGSQTYREDQITVNLRVVNIQNGLILHSVSSTKRIFSRQLNSGIFNFVDVDAILEIEAGYSYNEPGQLAINEAIESALISLISEGIVKNSWQLSNFEELKHPTFSKHLDEDQIDNFLKIRLNIAQQQQQQQQQSPKASASSPSIPKTPEARTQLEKEAARETAIENNRSEISTNKISNNNNQTKTNSILFLVGAYSRVDEANYWFETISNQVTEVDVNKVASEDGKFHSIHVGPIRETALANTIAEKLKAVGITKIKKLSALD